MPRAGKQKIARFAEVFTTVAAGERGRSYGAFRRTSEIPSEISSQAIVGRDKSMRDPCARRRECANSATHANELSSIAHLNSTR